MTQVYLDASVLVAMFTDDALTPRSDAMLRGSRYILSLSDFGAAELASAIGRLVRMNQMTPDTARAGFEDFDHWVASSAERVALTSADVKASEVLLRRMDLGLRTGGALHIAIARRTGATLATFDKRMGEAARSVEIAVIGV